MQGIFLSAIHCCLEINAALILFLILRLIIQTAIVEHEATTSKIGEDQIFYCNQRGIITEDAIGLIVNGYAREVINKLLWSLLLKHRSFFRSVWKAVSDKLKFI